MNGLVEDKKYEENDSELVDEELVVEDEENVTEETEENTVKEAEVDETNEASSSDEAEELKMALIRLQADFNNYRNRVNKEKAQMIRFATESLIEKLLPVLDNFDRAIESCVDNPSIAEGFSLIRADLMKTLEAQGLEEIASDGAKFDPNLHNAVVMEDYDGESGIITETFQKGYKLGDRVIRASMVKVSK